MNLNEDNPQYYQYNDEIEKEEENKLLVLSDECIKQILLTAKYALEIFYVCSTNVVGQTIILYTDNVNYTYKPHPIAHLNHLINRFKFILGQDEGFEPSHLT